MNSIEESDLKAEWSLLQNQSDSYEKYSLLIKLANIGLLGAAYFSSSMSVFVVFLLLVVWLQDAIWKTYQSRINRRLLQLENYLLNGVNGKAFQLNSDFLKSRAGVIQLIVENFRQAIKPTVAFPHVVLVLMLGLLLIK